jgi:hypothetical protein
MSRNKQSALLLQGCNRYPVVSLWLMLLSTALVFSGAAASPAGGAEYYVDAASGSDGNPGTPQQPWQTIGKGLASVQPGDTVLVRGGLYRETLSIRINGTADKRIAIQACPGETPILEGTTGITGWTPCAADEPGLTVNGVVNPHYANVYKAQVAASAITKVESAMLLENGEILQLAQWPDQSNNIFDSTTEYVTLTDSRNWGQRDCLWDPARLTQADHYWDGAVIRVWSHAANNFVLSKGIAEFLHSDGRITFDSPLSADLSNTAGSQPDAYSILNHPHVLDKAGEFYVGPVSGSQRTIYLWPRSTDHLAQGVAISVHSAGVYFPAGFGSYLTIDGFEIRGYAGDANGSTGGVIYPYYSNVPHEGTIIRNCRIVNNKGKAGIWLHGGTNDLIEHNTVHNLQGGRGIILSSALTSKIVRNTVSETGVTSIYLPGCNRCQAIGNAVGTSGVHGNGITVYQGARDILIANNIVTNASIAFTTQATTNLTLFNNVFQGSASYVVADWGDCAGTVAIMNNTIQGGPSVGAGLKLSTGPTYIVKNNILAGGGGGDRSNNLYTFLAWNQDARYGWSLASGEVVCKSLSTVFVDAANHDYRLAAGSPAINAGADVDTYLPQAMFPDFDFSRDITGISRDGTPDIGAYEYGSGGPVNRAPVLEPVGNRSVSINQQLSLTLHASDAEGDPLTYSATGLPSGATFSEQTFAWTPGSSQLGSYPVTFIVSDGQNQDSETVTITVERPNTAPVLVPIEPKSTSENTPLSFPVSATDGEGDPITYSATGLPSGASFTGQTFTWTPGYTQAGSYNVTFVASDGRAQAAQTVAITVINVDRPPTLAAIGDKSVDENNGLSFSISATDPDADALTYSATGLPAGANLTGSTFTWVPGADQAGSHEITFVASDGEMTDSETITVHVVRVGVDATAPVVARQSPAPDAIQVPLNHLVTLHITDAGSGVDANSVTIVVAGKTIYEGNRTIYSGADGSCTRSGSKNDYRFIFQSREDFDSDCLVTVKVDAADLAGNVMNEQTYSFATEMRSFSNNKQVSKSAGSSNKRMPATACDAAGHIWAAWHAGPEDARDIYVAKLAVGADAFDAPTRLTTDARDQCNPDIAVAADGSVYVVWQDHRAGNWDIYAAVGSADKFSREVQVTNSDKNEVNPALAADGQSPSQVWVAWQDDRDGNQDIYVAGTTNAFTDSTVARITSDVADQMLPDITVDVQNIVYVVWTDMRNGQADVYGAASNNGPWANVPVVTRAADQTDPAVTAPPDSSVLHLVWVDNTAGDRDVYYAKLTGLPASPVTGVTIIDDTSGADQIAPSIACSAGGEVFACWQDFRHVATDSADRDLYCADLSEGSVRTNVLVGDDRTNTNQSEPALAVDSEGQPYVVWSDDRNATPEIYFAAATYIDPDPLDAKDVLASAGATIGTDPAAIRSPEDVSIIVPARACQSNVRMTISKIINPQVSPIDCLGSYDFGPSGIDFDQPVTVTIPYRYSGGGRACPYWYDSLTGALSQQGITNVEVITVAAHLNALRFQTTHFTPFYVVAGDADATTTWGSGDGCSLSPTGDGTPGQLLVPYLLIAAIMLYLGRKDRKRLLKNTDA